MQIGRKGDVGGSSSLSPGRGNTKERASFMSRLGKKGGKGVGIGEKMGEEKRSPKLDQSPGEMDSVLKKEDRRGPGL